MIFCMGRPYFNTKNAKNSDEIKFMFYGRQANLSIKIISACFGLLPSLQRVLYFCINPEEIIFLPSLVSGHDDPLLTLYMQIWIVLTVRTSFDV